MVTKIQSLFVFALVSLLSACGDGAPGADGAAGPAGADGEPADRNVHVATFVGGQDSSMGLADGRILVMNKESDDTDIRVTYFDHLSASKEEGNPCVCTWEVLFNGQSCTSPGNVMGALVANFQNLESMDIQGWCSDLPAGEVTLTVNVSRTTTNCQCQTGYFNDLVGYIEAEELTIAE